MLDAHYSITIDPLLTGHFIKQCCLICHTHAFATLAWNELGIQHFFSKELAWGNVACFTVRVSPKEVRGACWRNRHSWNSDNRATSRRQRPSHNNSRARSLHEAIITSTCASREPGVQRGSGCSREGKWAQWYLTSKTQELRCSQLHMWVSYKETSHCIHLLYIFCSSKKRSCAFLTHT